MGQQYGGVFGRSVVQIKLQALLEMTQMSWFELSHSLRMDW